MSNTISKPNHEPGYDPLAGSSANPDEIARFTRMADEWWDPKGKFRPHVPEDLRALNLAAFELIDYVLVDHEDKPLKNMAYLQPDFFAKGYEYVSGGLPQKTQEEADILNEFRPDITIEL